MNLSFKLLVAAAVFVVSFAVGAKRFFLVAATAPEKHLKSRWS